MALIISEKKYDSIKKALGKDLTQAQIATREFCSQSVVSKVKNSKSYDDYRKSITTYNKVYNEAKKETEAKEAGFLSKLKGLFK